MIDQTGKLDNLLKNTNIGLPYLIETWQSNIEPNIWTINLGGSTGTVTRDVSEEPYQKVILDGPENNDVARLYTTHQWQLAPTIWGQNTLNKILVMEWEAKFVTPASILESKFLMGLTAGAAKTLIFHIYAVGINESEAYDDAVTVDTGVDITFNFSATTLQTDMMKATAIINPANVMNGDKLVLEFIRNVATDTLVDNGEMIDFNISWIRA